MENTSLDITVCQRIEYAYWYIQTFKLRNTFMGQTYRTNVRIIFYHWPLFYKDLTLAHCNIFKSSLMSVTDQTERQNKILVTKHKA